MRYVETNQLEDIIKYSLAKVVRTFSVERYERAANTNARLMVNVMLIKTKEQDAEHVE